MVSQLASTCWDDWTPFPIPSTFQPLWRWVCLAYPHCTLLKSVPNHPKRETTPWGARCIGEFIFANLQARNRMNTRQKAYRVRWSWNVTRFRFRSVVEQTAETWRLNRTSSAFFRKMCWLIVLELKNVQFVLNRAAQNHAKHMLHDVLGLFTAINRT